MCERAGLHQKLLHRCLTSWKRRLDGHDVLCERACLHQKHNISIPASSSMDANRDKIACFSVKARDLRAIVKVRTTCMAMGIDAINNTTQIPSVFIIPKLWRSESKLCRGHLVIREAFDTTVSDPVGLVLLREDASRLSDVVGTSGSPADGSWVPLVEDPVAVTIEPPVDTVVLELVDDVIERHEGVVDGDYLQIGIRRRGTEHEHSNTTEAIHAQLCRHGSQTVNMSGVSKTITSQLSPHLTQSAPGREPLRATLGRSAHRRCSRCLYEQWGRTLRSRERGEKATTSATRPPRSHSNSSSRRP